IRGTAHIQQGFDPGVELRGAQAIGGSDAVGTILPRGPRGGNIAVVFYAFDTTRSAGEFPQVASKSAGALPAENSARDVLVAAVTKLSIFLDELRGEQPVAFRQALVNVFRHERCTRCHGVHTDDPAMSTFPNGAGHPVPFPQRTDALGNPILNGLGNPITFN